MKLIIVVSWLLNLLIWSSLALPDTITIGGLFDKESEKQEQIAFRNAVTILNSHRKPARFNAITYTIDKDDSFSASKKVCQLLSDGVAAIFGPQAENTANHVTSICDAFEIPHIETRWNYQIKKEKYSINLYPHPKSLGQAYFDIIKKLNWKKFVVLYDDERGLIRLQMLLKNKDWVVIIKFLHKDADWRELLKQLKKMHETRFLIDVSQDNIFKLLKQASQMGLMREYHNYFITSLDMHLTDMEDFRYGGTNITSIRLIDPDNENIRMLVEQWKLNEQYQYGHTLPLDMTKVTTKALLIHDAVSLFERSLDDLDRTDKVSISPLYCEGENTWKHGNSLINIMKLYSSDRGRNFTEPIPRPPMIYPHPESMHGVNRMYNPPGYQPYPMNGYSVWNNPTDGLRFYNNNSRFYEKVEIRGLTGVIKFDEDGLRTDFDLEITELDQKLGMKMVGKWSKETGANFSRNYAEVSEMISASLQNKTLIVTTAITPPYTMNRETSESLTGNDRYEGFCIDLIHKIAENIGFNYTFRETKDGSYGSKNKETGEWNGMVRELLDHEADLAIVDFTITYEREEAVDFSMPFMNLGIGIIYKKPQKKPPSLFSFMSPFSIDVWIYMATAYLGVSVLLFVLARMTPKEWDSPYPCIQEPEELENCFTLQNSLWFIIATFLCQGADIAPRVTPNEWDNPHPCIQDPDELENSITLNNAFWFTIGSLMQQGSDIAPKAVSTRIVAGIWWFFTLIMISSYTANLAAFLTVERMESPIESAEDLASQTKIKYGCKKGGSTYAFFSESNIPTYQKMWSAMSNARPTVFTEQNEDGVERVSSSNGMYAFLMESVSIEYVVERRCDLMQVGGLLDSKSYGIALPPGSPYTGSISSAILKLKEDGVLYELKKKWWKQGKGAGNCESDDTKGAGGKAAELDLDNVGGVFVVLIGGMGISTVAAICEFLWTARDLATDENISFCEELGNEVKFIIKCSGNTKPVKKAAPATPDEALFNYGSFNGTNYGYASGKK